MRWLSCGRWLAAGAAALGAAAPCGALTLDAGLDPGHWRLVASPGMVHFNASDEHRWVWAVGVERQRDDGWMWGGVFFSNSFGQPSGYAYVGHRYAPVLDQPSLFAQWSAGLMYGYVGEYQDKVPFNVRGFSPGAVLSLGWQFDARLSAQMNLLGSAGLMLQVSYDLP